MEAKLYRDKGSSGSKVLLRQLKNRRWTGGRGARRTRKGVSGKADRSKLRNKSTDKKAKVGRRVKVF